MKAQGEPGRRVQLSGPSEFQTLRKVQGQHLVLLTGSSPLPRACRRGSWEAPPPDAGRGPPAAARREVSAGVLRQRPPPPRRGALSSLVRLPGQVGGACSRAPVSCPHGHRPMLVTQGLNPVRSSGPQQPLGARPPAQGPSSSCPPAPYGMSRGPQVPASMCTHPCRLDLSEDSRHFHDCAHSSPSPRNSAVHPASPQHEPPAPSTAPQTPATRAAGQTGANLCPQAAPNWGHRRASGLCQGPSLGARVWGTAGTKRPATSQPRASQSRKALARL